MALNSLPGSNEVEASAITTIVNAIWKLRILKDTRGQDFLEYALIAAFIAAAYAAVTPSVGPSVTTVFSKITSSLVKSGG